MSNPEDLSPYVETQQMTFVKSSQEKEIQSSDNANEVQPHASLLSQQPIFDPNTTLEERAISGQATDNFKSLHQDLKSFRPVSVIALNGDFFGIDLNMVREFIDIRKVTPIPCCPTHIIGNMNLRGEILTLIDIRGLLNLPLGMTDGYKAMVVEVEGIVAGVIVEEVCDAMFLLNPLEIRAVRKTTQSTNYEYFEGVTLYDEKMMIILDLPKILLKGGLTIDEVI